MADGIEEARDNEFYTHWSSKVEFFGSDLCFGVSYLVDKVDPKEQESHFAYL